MERNHHAVLHDNELQGRGLAARAYKIKTYENLLSFLATSDFFAS